MKKIKFITSTILALIILIGSVSKISAKETPLCEWKTHDSGEFFYISGFESKEDAKKHALHVYCGSCGASGDNQKIDLKDQIVREKAPGTGDYEIRFYIRKQIVFHEEVRKGVWTCLEKGGTKESCTPTMSFHVKAGFIAENWCLKDVPAKIFLGYMDEMVDPILPTLTSNPLNPVEGGVTKKTLDALNPLLIAGTAENAEELSTPGGIISRLLRDFIFPAAGLILFVMLILGGFGMVAGATNKKALEASQQRMTSAIVGFILLFSSFWIMRLIEMIFGLKIL